MRLALVLGYLAVAALAGVGGWLMGCPHKPTQTAMPLEVVAAAQAKSPEGAQPKWMDVSVHRKSLQMLRDRGYRFCFDGQKVEVRCALQQDEAVRFIATLPLLLRDQRQVDPAKRTAKYDKLFGPRGVADQAQQYCWDLYKVGPAADARIPAACLSNLADGGIVVPTPVP